MSHFRTSQMRFVVVGLSNTVIGFGAIWIALRVLRLGDVAANAGGYMVGFLWSFLLNRSWTFGHRGKAGAAIFRYAQVCAAAYLVNLVVVILAGRSLGQGSLIAQACGMLTYTVLCYAGSRAYAFPVHRARDGD